MSGFAKGMLFALVALYFVSPIDACPGPVDDILFLMISLAATKKRPVIVE